MNSVSDWGKERRDVPLRMLKPLLQVVGMSGSERGSWMGEGGRRDLEGEDDDLALPGPLQARVAVGLETREGRERDLLLGRVLRAA